VALIEARLAEDILNLRLCLRIFAAIVGIQDCALRRVRVFQGRVDASRTFAVQLRLRVKIKVVVRMRKYSPSSSRMARIRFALVLDGEGAEEQPESDRVAE